MMGPFRFVIRLLGIVILLAIFGATYILATSITPDTAKFDTQPKAIGEAGGFHLLTDVEVEEHKDFWRVAIFTTLNRVSPLFDQIATPQVAVTAPLPNDNAIQNANLGDYFIQIDLSDTSVSDTSSGTSEYVFQSPEIQAINEGVINELSIRDGADDNSYQIVVGLDSPVQFRLHENPEQAGIVWVDILK